MPRPSSSRNTNNMSSSRVHLSGLIAGLGLILVLIVAIVLNIHHAIDSTTSVVNTLNTDDGDTKIDWSHYDYQDITLTGSLNIVKSGTYHLTGTLADGSINVAAGAESVVRLILDGVSITNSSGPAIYCSTGDDLVIELVGDNSLSDGTTYTNSYDTDVTGAIYSKSDLTFTGTGSLTIGANYQDGIISKDDLKFTSGTYHITAVDDAIRGKDSIYITGGSFILTAAADGIKSTNDTDSGKGFVLIQGGDFNLTTGAKGIKSTHTVLIEGGNFAITSTDDSLHSNDYLGISGGTLNLSSSDDGIHADRAVVIDNGTVNVVQSYEGIESENITINGGTLSITANDDGINAGGGTDASAANRPGAGPLDGDERCIININGGEIYVNAAGDGIDSNGWLYFNGGNVVVDGPVNDGNGALDSSLGIIMNGGTVIAVGSSGMASSLGSTSNVDNVSAYLSSAYPAGTLIEFRDSTGNIILSHTSAKSFSHISAGTNNFQLGESYGLYLNGELYQSFTISGITTTIGSPTNNQPMAPGQSGPQSPRR